MQTPLKVLLLDDHEDARLLQQTILESHGYQVITAENGIEGWSLLNAEHPDIIISDLLMPEMDGFEFCMKVKKDPQFAPIPFLFYSAQYTDERDQKLVEEVGADRFILKPISIEAFLAIVEEVFESHRNARETSSQVLQSSEPMGSQFDQEHYKAQARMLDKKLHELEEEHRKLRTSEAQYRRLVEGLSADYFIYRHDCDGIFTYLSPTVVSMLGYDIEEFRTHYTTYLTDTPTNQEVARYTQRALKGEITPAYTVELYAKDGSLCFLQVNEQPLFDAQGHVVGIEGIARNITAEREAERHKEESAQKLHAALIDTIQAISMTVEKRDPYTAGHQQRVADLAVAIGNKMALNVYRLEGLRLGALVHDIGKISIPAEILTKPGVLSDIEFRLIQSHCTQGYEILQHIDFPWPLAQMVLQHHERIDGSGYPKGLKGNEILLEAKILCVADVVEAMTSDRPYRPGLGFQAAMEEIESFRGTRYDADVVDSCLSLLQGGHFSFRKL